MKKMILVTFVLLVTNTIVAQVFVGKIKPSKSIYLNSPKELKPEDFSKIKNTKTFFVYEEEIYKSSFSKSEFKSLIKDSWNITEYEVIENSEILEKVKVGNAIVYFTSDELRVIGSGRTKTGIENTRVEFGILKEFKKKKKNIELDIDIYADIYINIGTKTFISGVVTIDGNRNPLKMNVSKAQFINYIKFVNNRIEKNESYVSWGDRVNPIEITKLKTNKLYVSYLNMGGHTLEEYFDQGYSREKVDRYSYDKFKKTYNYELVSISEKELSDLILKKMESNENLFYITLNASRHFKIVNIFDLNGEIIFQNYQGASWLLKSRDFKNINKAIDKGKF